MSDKLINYLLLFILALIWSTSFMLIKIGVQTVGPMTLTAIRLVIATSILWLILLIRGERIPWHKTAWLLYVVVGILGNTLPFILISRGELTADSTMAAILMGCMPIGTFVLAHFFLHDETMTRRKATGVALGFSGLLTLIGFSALRDFGGNAIGELTILAGAISYAVTTVFIRTQPRFSGYQMAAGVALVATITSIPPAFIFEDPLSMTPSMESLVAIVLLAVFATAIASILYYRVLGALGATTFSQINYIIPVLGSIWGVLILNEQLEPNIILALVMVLSGIYLIQGPSRQGPSRKSGTNAT